ncbi:TonB-dependent receptor plug domain-containing protein [Duganella sp. FT80W]|uniref:TonB-dependent receptor plug domain-containing protein n=1 Tax=Duganella guangzhouensis TaxID=2666084 RepID=A0A6I2L9V5_9BURK|nr:TonB-dependent receptor [Duganella guangzhouensis]MRW93496.1 TonB-dependent receptor plug domain-containing protein [Duganella guangzhouensis]
MKKPQHMLVCGVSMLTLCVNASAQTDEAPLTSVTVTGSRVIKNGDSNPSPTTVVTADDLLTSRPGSTLADALNTLPVFAGSRGSASNPTTAGSAAGGSGSANQLNLRNIGATRTLVLMDGKRIPPTLYNGAVDVDLIPQQFVERVDVVTGGVSAVYGSDAMTGVVNYIIDHKFNGIKADASYGKSSRNDAAKSNASLAWGANLGQGLHVEAGVEYRKEGGIDNRSDRDWLNQVGVTGAGTAANPYVLQSNLRQKSFPFGGLITSGALAGQTFKSNGVLSPFVAGTATGTSAIEVGGDGGYWDSGLLARLQATQLFGRADYDINRDIHAYAQLSGNLKTNTNFAETNQLSGVSLRRTNAFLPAEYQALIPTTQSSFTFSKFLSDIPRLQADSDSKQWVFVTGLEGKTNGWKWDVDYTYGRSKLNTAMANVLNRQKLSAALDAVSSGGKTVCNVTVTNPGLMDNCVPLNVFGPSAASQQAIDYVTDTVFFDSLTTMNDITGQLSGKLLDNWAGPVNGAISAEWRDVAFKSHSSSRPTDLVNCTGLTLNCSSTATLTEYVFGESPQGVSQRVWEVAGEIDVPLSKSLSANGAARYTSYNTSGNYTTWKVGLDWSVTDKLRIRTTRSRDIRAPTLYDLFAPQSQVVVRPTDLLTGTSNAVPQIDQSNPDLKAEIGNTMTLGAVWKPLPKLSFAADAYRIKISDAITTVSGSTTAFQQACYASGGTSPYCALQIRPNGYTSTAASNAVTAWINRSVNISEVETFGLDLEGNYAGKLFDRPASFRLLTAWQPHVYYRQPGLATVDQGGVAFGAGGMASTPAVRVSAYFRFRPMNDFTVDINQRWRSAMKLSGDPAEVWVNNHMRSFATTGVNFAYKVDLGMGDAQVYFNIENLFDATPPIGAYSGNGTRAGLRDGFALADDPRGRYFTLGIRSLF